MLLPPTSHTYACVRAKSLQSCPTLCNPVNHSWSGSFVHGIFSRQEYWSGLPYPLPGDLPDPGIKPTSLTSPALALAGRFFTTEPPGKLGKNPLNNNHTKELFIPMHSVSIGCSNQLLPLVKNKTKMPKMKKLFETHTS